MMKIKMTILLIAAAAILLATEPVTATGDLSLAQAISRGLENNYSIRISRQDQEIARNNNTWGAAGRYPVIDLGLAQNNSYTDSPPLGANSLVPSLTLRWTLFDGFAIKISKQKLALLNEISGGSAAVIVENTIQAIVLAYYNLLLQREKLAVTREVFALSKDRRDYVATRREIGSATTHDMLQAEIAMLDDTSAVLRQEHLLNDARRSLNLLLGEAAEAQLRPVDTFAATAKHYELEPLIEKMWSLNKTLRNQYINQEILKRERALQQSAQWPSLSLSSGIRHTSSRSRPEGQPPATSTSLDYYVNFSIGLNLFNGGNTRRAIANARIRERVAALQVKEMKLSMANRLRRYLELYNLRKQLLEVAEERIKSATLNLQISGEKFKAGAINSFNYRDVQLIYLNSAFGKHQAIYDLVEADTELARLTGAIIAEY
jgi:outer membrane protein TolC